MADVVPLWTLLGLAFGAGVLAFFSPCSIAMLPTYVAYQLGMRGTTRVPGAPLGTPAVANGGAPPGVLPAAVLLFVIAGVALLTALVNSLRENTLGFDPSQLALSLLGLATFVGGIGVLAYGIHKGAGLTDLREGLVRGVALGVVTTAGLTTVLALLGIAIVAGASAIQAFLPEVVVATAVVIVAIGVLVALGRRPTLIPGVRAPRGRGYFSSYSLGIGYALVSTGCNLPIFLLVVGLALQATVASPWSGLATFLVYTTGNALVLVLLMTYVAVAHRSAMPWLRRALPYIERGSGLVMAAMGLYILWYDYTNVLRPAGG